jgi:hypothetical protein
MKTEVLQKSREKMSTTPHERDVPFGEALITPSGTLNGKDAPLGHGLSCLLLMQTLSQQFECRRAGVIQMTHLSTEDPSNLNNTWK